MNEKGEFVNGSVLDIDTFVGWRTEWDMARKLRVEYPPANSQKRQRVVCGIDQAGQFFFSVASLKQTR
jgi:hypothetical protein